MSAIRNLLTAVFCIILVAGCASIPRPFDTSEFVDLDRAEEEIPEKQLLDVWVEVFDPGVLPEDEDEASGLTMDIREAEARMMPVLLRNAMERTGYWGAVRVVPRKTTGAEVLVRGVILASDAETLYLQITAHDATGRRWFDRTYRRSASEKDYTPNPDQSLPEVFESVYNDIANDLSRYRGKLDTEEISTIRRVAELRFAADLAPAAFGGHLKKTDAERYGIKRLPALGDPMYGRIKRIRERDLLLMDTLNGHFDNFHREMEKPYGEWRKARVKELAALREIEREALKRKLLGAAAIAGAIAIEVFGNSDTRNSTGTLRNVMVLGGAYAIKTGFDKDSETTIHREVIEELGESFTSDARPLVVEIEGETHELTGSAEAQYQQWRKLLHRIYASETGLVEAAD